MSCLTKLCKAQQQIHERLWSKEKSVISHWASKIYTDVQWHKISLGLVSNGKRTCLDSLRKSCKTNKSKLMTQKGSENISVNLRSIEFLIDKCTGKKNFLGRPNTAGCILLWNDRKTCRMDRFTVRNEDIFLPMVKY